MPLFYYSIHHDNYIVITELQDYYAFTTELKIVNSGVNTKTLFANACCCWLL